MKTLKMTNLVILILGILSSCEIINEEDVFNNSVSLPRFDHELSQIIERSSFENASIPMHKDISCEECDFVIETNISGAFDGDQYKVKPGDKIGLKGSGTYKSILFRNLKGTVDNPITIVNCNGQAVIESFHTYGILFQGCENIRLLGNGDTDHAYGIKVSTVNGFFINATLFTTDIEIGFIEIGGPNRNGLGENSGFAGIGVKTKPYCDGSANRGIWTCKNVWIHHNYIHDTGGEGMYIGYGFYTGRIERDCDVITYSHSIENLKIHDNIVANCGYDGMQIKNADKNVEVFGNIIYNYGTRNESIHNEGLLIGEGTTGNFYNNWIVKGTGDAIFFHGMGNINIFNNVVINSGADGFFGSGGTYVYRIPEGYFNIYNNTFINSGHYGFVFYENSGGPKNLVNNLIVKAGVELYKEGAVFNKKENNLLLNNIEEAKFRDFYKWDFRPANVESPMVDNGEDLNSIFTFDAQLVSRPQGEKFDIGAFELEQ